MELLTTTAAPFGITLNLYYQGTGTLAYTLIKDGTELFTGDSFKASPMRNIDDLETALDCLSFFAVQPGDTDDEYFAAYTPAQLAWAKSYECEQLSGLIHDAEDRSSEYHADALQQFTHIIA